MRRIVLTAFPLAALSFTVFYSLRAADAPKPKVKAAAKVVPAAVSYGNSDSITKAEVKIYDYFLASDQLEGRNLPSRGFDTAALYVASHLAEWGLKPGGSASGTNGPLQPYFIPMELVAKTVAPAESKATISGVGGGRGGRGGRGGGGRGAGTDGAATTPRSIDL